ncbi:hypothetical protein PoB_003747900, partial [Plakobranchus ocellatus]
GASSDRSDLPPATHARLLNSERETTHGANHFVGKALKSRIKLADILYKVCATLMDPCQQVSKQRCLSIMKMFQGAPLLKGGAVRTVRNPGGTALNFHDLEKGRCCLEGNHLGVHFIFREQFSRRYQAPNGLAT